MITTLRSISSSSSYAWPSHVHRVPGSKGNHALSTISEAVKVAEPKSFAETSGADAVPPAEGASWSEVPFPSPHADTASTKDKATVDRMMTVRLSSFSRVITLPPSAPASRAGPPILCRTAGTATAPRTG